MKKDADIIEFEAWKKNKGIKKRFQICSVDNFSNAIANALNSRLLENSQYNEGDNEAEYRAWLAVNEQLNRCALMHRPNLFINSVLVFEEPKPPAGYTVSELDRGNPYCRWMAEV